MTVIIAIDCSLGRFNPWNWWKECSWTLRRLKNPLNWQETGIFEKKKTAAGRQMKSPILRNRPNFSLTRGRPFQNSPIRWVNRGIGNTGYMCSGYSKSSSRCVGFTYWLYRCVQLKKENWSLVGFILLVALVLQFTQKQIICGQRCKTTRPFWENKALF